MRSDGSTALVAGVAAAWRLSCWGGLRTLRDSSRMSAIKLVTRPSLSGTQMTR